jgi:hypothetical protein
MRLGLLAAADPEQRADLMTLAHADDTAFGASTTLTGRGDRRARVRR